MLTADKVTNQSTADNLPDFVGKFEYWNTSVDQPQTV